MLAPGGRAAFTVWGQREDSEFFTIPKKNMMKFEKFKAMADSSNARSPFHLNDRNKVLDTMEEVGFKGCRSIELYSFFDFSDDTRKENLERHVRFALRDLEKSVKGNEEDQKLYDELVEMSVKDYTKILVEDRRLFGYKSYMYYGNK